MTSGVGRICRGSAHPPIPPRGAVDRGREDLGTRRRRFRRLDPRHRLRDHPDWQVAASDNLKRRGSEVERASGLRSPMATCAIRPIWTLEPGWCASGGSQRLVPLGEARVISQLQPRRHDRLPRASATAGWRPRLPCPTAALSIAGLRALLERRCRTAPPGGRRPDRRAGLPLAGGRSLYGAANRPSRADDRRIPRCVRPARRDQCCGVLAGPWRLGKVDQGLVALWMARHLYGGPLAFTGSAAGAFRCVTCCTSRISTISLPCRRNRWTVGQGGVRNVVVEISPAAHRSVS